MSTVAKYFTIFKVSLSERMVYRFNFVIGVFIRFLPMVSTIFLWKAVFESNGKQPIEAYTFQGMVAYYMLIWVARSFSSMPSLARTIAQEIRDGELNKYLIRPLNYLGYNFMLRMAHKTTYFMTASVPFAVVATWLVHIGYFAPWPGWTTFGWFVLALILAFVMGYLVNLLVGLIGFWFLEVNTFLFIYMMLEYFCNGHMFPLDILPKPVARIVLALPFHFQAFFPATIFLNRYTPEKLMTEFAIELGWILFLFVLVTILFRRGLKRYGAYGG